MKVVVAMDSFKGCISSIDGSQAVALGIHDVWPEAEVDCIPLADGGEGTVEALVAATGGKYIPKSVTGPLGSPVEAVYGVLGDNHTAVIEVAAACGLPLVQLNERNPLLTTSYGVGELIADALSRGCRSMIIGLGGSATNDAGTGMLQALGFRFLDSHGQEAGRGGQSLAAIRSIELAGVNPELAKCRFHVACDVNNPFYGEHGAAYVFAPQKGAGPEMVQQLDLGMRSFADVVKSATGKDIQRIAGAGAAGGLGAAFSALLNAKLEPGIQLIASHAGLQRRIADADFVITGEGKLDEQTSMGKAPIGMAKLARQLGIPVLALGGSIPQDTTSLNEQGITSCFSITNGPMSLEEAMEKQVALNNLRLCASQLFRLIRAIR